jgi:hypothetical protein
MRWAILFFLFGCATQRYSLPMTAAELTSFSGSQALEVYLGQADASPAVCDLRGSGPHIAPPSHDTRGELFAAFRDGRVPPEIFRRCVQALLGSAEPTLATELLGQVADAYDDLVRDAAVETDAAAQARLQALHRIYLRQNAGTGRLSAVDHLTADLREALENKKLGPTAARYASELLDELGLSQGAWRGQRLDLALLDQLAGNHDEKALMRIAARAPETAMRLEARRRVVRLRVQGSQWAEVQKDPEVENRVISTGVNAVTLSEHPPVGASLAAPKVPVPAALVEQQPLKHETRLLGATGPEGGVLPEVRLRGALSVQLRGFSRPLGICRGTAALDPTPCISLADVKTASPLATVDAEGNLHVTESIGQTIAMALARQISLSIPVAVGSAAVSVEWPLLFQRPADLIFSGSGPGSEGPALAVEVERLATGRVLYSISRGSERCEAAVEWPDAAAFHVVSRGADGIQGSAGLPGSDGVSGTSGSSASCPSFWATDGSDGGPGGDGGSGDAGGPGGQGGDVHVIVQADPAHISETLAAATRAIRSMGGAGGRGGRGGSGGRGGAGGSGGSGTTCTDSDGRVTFLSAGRDGHRGFDGTDGFDGATGRAGTSGHVTFETR